MPIVFAGCTEEASMLIESYVVGDLLEKMSTVCFVAYLLTRTKGIFNFIEKERSWKYIAVISLIFGFFYAFGYYAGIGTETYFLSIRKIGPNMAGLLAGPAGGLGAAVVGLILQGMGSAAMTPATIITELIDGTVCGMIYLLNNRRLVRVWQAGVLGLCLTGADAVIEWLLSPESRYLEIFSFTIVLIEICVIAAGMALFTLLIHNVTHERERNITASCLEGQVQAAREIQQGYLPVQLNSVKGVSITAQLIPMHEVGGDFYDFHQISESKLYFCIGDVAGKGVSAAFVMASTLTLLRNALIYSEQPAEILSQVNQGLVRSSHDSLFVTLFVGVLNLKDGKVSYANAGHVPPLLISGSSARIIPVNPDIPVGTWEEYQYQQEEFDLKPGNQLVLYTDGVTECENQDGMLGIDPVLRVLSQNQLPDTDSIVESITRLVFAYAGTGIPTDDVTVLAIGLDSHDSEENDDGIPRL